MEEIVLLTNLSDYLLKMFQVDYVALIIAMVTVAVGILAIKKFIDEFASAFGFVPIWTRKKMEEQKERNEIRTQLTNLTENQQKIKDIQASDVKKMDALSTCLVEVREDISKLSARIDKRERDKEFRRLRWRIINFANELPIRDEISFDVWNEVWDGIKKYEEMCEKYDYKNGQTTSSVNVITQRYEHDIALGKIAKEEDK